MKRILFVDHTPFMGGGQLVLVEHIAELDKTQFEPHVVCTDTVPELVEKFQQSGAVVHVLSLPRLRGFVLAGMWQLFRSAWQLRKLLLVLKIDLIVANSTRASYMTWLASLATGIPIIWWVRDFLYPKLLFNLLKYRPSKIVCVSKSIAEFYLPAGDKKAVVLYVASNIYKDLDSITYHQIVTKKAEYGIKPKDIVVGYMGRLVEEKGPEDVVMAVLRLLPQYDKLHLMIVGTGRDQEGNVEERLHQLVSLSNHSDRVHFTGYQSDQALYYALFSIFTLTTRDHEPFATSVVQAMMAGVAVVGTNAGGTPELIIDSQTGLLYPPGDVNALTGAIQLLLDDPGRATLLAEEGRKIVMAQHKEEQLARRAEALYAEVLG